MWHIPFVINELYISFGCCEKLWKIVKSLFLVLLWKMPNFATENTNHYGTKHHYFSFMLHVSGHGINRNGVKRPANYRVFLYFPSLSVIKMAPDRFLFKTV